jgi:hypothetical protein
LSEHCFAPSLDDLDADWLASVATPAFHILARVRPAVRRQSFLSMAPKRLTAREALTPYRSGTEIRHAVVALLSEHL